MNYGERPLSAITAYLDKEHEVRYSAVVYLWSPPFGWTLTVIKDGFISSNYAEKWLVAYNIKEKKVNDFNDSKPA